MPTYSYAELRAIVDAHESAKSPALRAMERHTHKWWEGFDLVDVLIPSDEAARAADAYAADLVI